jgi:hypothetical protein
MPLPGGIAVEAHDEAAAPAGAEPRLIAYQLGPDAPPLRRAGPRRAWIDAMPERHAYRCLPLVIADQLGWDLINPATFTAAWNGRDGPEDVEIAWAEGHWSGLPMSHFGHGILTFRIAYVFRTPPGVSLLVCGPPNAPKDGACALAGVVETDWSPTTFTMSYRLTRPGLSVTFEAGEPFCRLVPLELRLLEQLRPELRLVSDDPDLERRHGEWKQSRERFLAESRVLFSPAHEQGWQRDYFQGSPELGASPSEHRTGLRHREFTDLRPPERQPAGRPVPAPKAALAVPGPEEAFPRQAPETDFSVVAAAALLRDLTEPQRRQVLQRFCRRCGREDPRCGCSGPG